MKMRGDLSAPVLAILVTIGIIAAGLVLLAWFWWFAPQAGKTGVLQIIGQPALVCNKTGTTVSATAAISVKNTGSESLTITAVYIDGRAFYNETVNVMIDPGKSRGLNITLTPSVTACPETYTVDGVVVTTAGTYSTSFTVIKK